MRIIFMGTPDFAIPSLEKLNASAHDVVAVVSQPDKPKGRKMQLIPTPVKQKALELGIPVYQPETLKNGAFLPVLEELAPDIIVVVAYGKLLPDYILEFPKFGCINLHGSLLPRYRGAAPMQRSIMEGEKEIGATIMYMASGLDTGDMISKCSLELTDNMNFEDVHDKLADMGSDLLVETLENIFNGAASREPQDDSLATHAAKIEDNDMKIDFSFDARTVHNRIRGISPVPCAYTTIGGKKLKIVKTEILDEETEHADFGKVSEFIHKRGLRVLCSKGSLLITEVIPEGKKRMNATDFYNGRGITIGEFLGK